jgi:osmotically-inducible protein OsmY
MHRTLRIRSRLFAGMVGAALATLAVAATPDAQITSATRTYLLTGSRAPAVDLSVGTREGVVRLFRVVPSQEGKAAATYVRKMGGVQRVENEEEILDEEMGHEVKQALDRPAFKDITVEVKNSVVRLTGTVPSWAWRLEAVAVARAIPGVRAVEDDLHFMLAV